MFYQIPSFLLDVIVGLLGGACLLRLYMQYHRVPFGNPLGRFIFAVTDWIVLPLRRVLPPGQAQWDLASLVAAPAAGAAEVPAAVAADRATLGRIGALPLVSLIGLVQLAVSGLTALLVIVYAVLSWVPSASPMLLDLISTGWPSRWCGRSAAFIPLVGGVDLSPLAAIVVLQVIAIVLSKLLVLAYRSVRLQSTKKKAAGTGGCPGRSRRRRAVQLTASAGRRSGIASVLATVLRSSRRSPMMSMAPLVCRNSARWKPSGSVTRTV